MLFKNILVGFDGSKPARKALTRALGLAQSEGSTVTVLSSDEAEIRYAPGVGEIQEEKGVHNAFCHEMFQQALAMAQEQGVEIKTYCTNGNSGEALLQYARTNPVDLIAIGHAAHGGLLDVLLGSSAARIVEHAPCDVLVVR